MYFLPDRLSIGVYVRRIFVYVFSPGSSLHPSCWRVRGDDEQRVRAAPSACVCEERDFGVCCLETSHLS